MDEEYEVYRSVAGSGRYRVSLIVTDTGDGLSALLTGGTHPHVGGLALAGERLTSMKLEGHRDDEAAAEVADILRRSYCNKYNKTVPVAVVAGIHIDNASKDEIDLLIHNCVEAATSILCYI